MGLDINVLSVKLTIVSQENCSVIDCLIFAVMRPRSMGSNSSADFQALAR